MRDLKRPHFVPTIRVAGRVYSSMSTPPDAVREYDLAARARQSDLAALEELASRLRGAMFGVAFSICGQYDDAQDAVASAFVRICRNLPRLRDPARVRAFVLQTVRREAYRLYRSRPSLAPLSGLETTEDASPLLRLDIERTLKDLPALQARTILLFYFEGLGVGEIARMLERPEGTIKYWLHRGRAHLHSALEGYAPMTTSPSSVSIAAVISTELPEETLSEMRSALRSADWEDIRLLDQPTTFLLSQAQVNGNSRLALHDLLSGCRLVILDEWIGGHSAFALSTLIRSGAEGANMNLMLLASGGRTEAESSATAMAAYIAGFDLMLTKPFEQAEFEKFARFAREKPRG